jgi:hypothetical protein
MDKLSKSEIKILKLLDTHVGAPSDKEETIKFLRNVLAFNHHQSLDYFKLWYLNKEDIIPYEEMEDIDRGNTFLTRILSRIINSETSPKQEIDDIQDENKKDYDKLMGPWWYLNCNRYSGKLPCIEWEKDGIVLNLDTDQWADYFSGLNDDGIWVYRNATSYYSDYNEDFSSEEFDYAIYDDDIIDKFKQLSEMSGLDDYPGRGGDIPEEKISNFLMSILTSDEFDRVREDYLGELGIAVSRGRNKSVVSGYEEEVNFPNIVCDGGGDDCIKIPYEDLMVLVKDNNLLNLSELKDLEINGEIPIEEYYYDAWYDDEGRDDVLKEFNDILQRVIDNIEESDADLVGRMENFKTFYLYLKKLGIKQDLNYWENGTLWKSKDGKIIIHSKNYNPDNNTLKFSYNGEDHIVPLEELVNWVQGSILDLNESVRIGKYRLMMETIEQPDNITKIVIFDFDGTLMNTPHPDSGKKEWEEKTGKDYPHRGWWSKRESLDTNVFDIPAIKDTVTEYLVEYEDPNTLVIMLTGRLPNQADQVEDILNSQGIVFDEYHYKDGGDTLKSKLNTLRSLLNRYPNVNYIEMYEDREPHAIAFEKWGKENDVNIKVNLVTTKNS